MVGYYSTNICIMLGSKTAVVQARTKWRTVIGPRVLQLASKTNT